MVLPLESDTDARFARRECDYSEIGREICISSSTRENVPDEMRTSWKLLVDVMSKSFRKRSRFAQKTAVTLHVQRQAPLAQTMTRSKVQNMSKPDRADRSSVAGCNDADLEQTAAQSPGKMLQNLEPTIDELERENESRKAPPDRGKERRAERG